MQVLDNLPCAGMILLTLGLTLQIELSVIAFRLFASETLEFRTSCSLALLLTWISNRGVNGNLSGSPYDERYRSYNALRFGGSWRIEIDSLSLRPA
jgi:hypothetical protein